MRNIDKKWTLFIVSTFICVYGILYTLLNVTFAADVLPVDKNFTDINFYKCVIDSYNENYSLNLDYDEMMDYNKLKNLKVLKCNNKDLMDRDKIVSSKGIELITSLEKLTLTYTNIANIDLSSNKMIREIDLEGNTLIDNLYVYKGEKTFLNKVVNVSGELINNEVVWNNQNRNVVDISFYNMVYAKDIGKAVILGESNFGYNVINNINVINISSSKYKIDEAGSRIFIDDINNFDIQDIYCNDDNVLIEVYYNDLELYVKYNDNILKKFVLVEGDV